jgi:predicted nucleic acid-binding protein
MARRGESEPFPPRVFCDTSFLYACLDPLDANHGRALEASRAAAKANCRLYATLDVIGETATLLRSRCSYEAASTFISMVKPLLEVVPIDDLARAEAERVFLARGRARRLSMCDAISYVAVTRVLGGVPCLSFDSDFRRLGLEVVC